MSCRSRTYVDRRKRGVDDAGKRQIVCERVLDDGVRTCVRVAVGDAKSGGACDGADVTGVFDNRSGARDGGFVAGSERSGVLEYRVSRGTRAGIAAEGKCVRAGESCPSW